MTGAPQSFVNIFPAPGISGEFCSDNPRASMLAGVGALVAGPSGLTVGSFAWANEQGQANNYYTAGARLGFATIYQPVVITPWLGASGLMVQPGQEVTLHDSCDVWCLFASGATQGQKVFANITTGAAVSAVSGSVVAGGSATGAIAANATCTFTGVIAAPVFPDTGLFVMTASSVTGTIVPGAALAGTGVASGQTVIAQLSGTTGGAGTYSVSQPSSTASTTITATYGVLTISGSVTGAFAVGQPISGTGVVAGTSITGLGTGTGGDGTYYVNNNTVVSSTTITGAGAVETKWFVQLPCAAGEVTMISKSIGQGV
jgi:hypothetical protein